MLKIIIDLSRQNALKEKKLSTNSKVINKKKSKINK